MSANRRVVSRSTGWLVVVAMGVWLGLVEATDPTSTLDCHKRMYSYKVTQSDSQGRICSDTINVMSCWGRCDSNEISDWRFPFKRSFHPVCLHGAREPRTVVLKNCEDGYEPGTELHTYLHATTCRCHVCKSSKASCEGFRTAEEREMEKVSSWNSLLYFGDDP